MENTGRDTLNYAHENVVEKFVLTFKQYVMYSYKNPLNHNKILLTQKLFYIPTIWSRT